MKNILTKTEKHLLIAFAFILLGFIFIGPAEPLTNTKIAGEQYFQVLGYVYPK